MTTAPERFAAWLSTDIAPVLRERGFTKSRSTFHRRAPAGWGVVDFQKSQWGSKLETRFTINLAVALDRLTTARGDDPSRKPLENRSHWRCRIGRALGVEDRWWSVTEATDLRPLTDEVLADLARVLPLIDERLDDAGFLAAAEATAPVGSVTFFRGHELRELLTEGEHAR